jgi:GntR family transcriptional regulator
MLIVLDVHSGVPTYRQIVEQVRLQIASGQLGAGVELPSTRQLAQQLGINPMTVSKAYGLLEQEGALEHRPGLPLTVRARSGAAQEAAREAELRSALEPAALAAKQLGVSTTKAVQLFRQILAELQAEIDEEKE